MVPGRLLALGPDLPHGMLQEGCEPVVLPLQVGTYPDFRIEDHQDLVAILGMTRNSRVETYNRHHKRWDCHSRDTIQQIETGDVLLFRKLPAGVTGPRLQACPGLDTEIARLTGPVVASKKRIRETGTERHTPAQSPGFTKNARTIMNTWVRDKIKISNTKESPTRLASVSNVKPSSSQSVSTRLSWSPFNSSRSDSPRTPSNVASPASNPIGGPVHDYPWAGKEKLRGGERPWPSSFFAVDIIDGFERIDILCAQRRPKINQDTAFEVVFGLQYHKSTYLRHYKIYNGNNHLAQKYKQLGRSLGSSWTEFIEEATKGKISNPHDENTSDSGESVPEGSELCKYCDELLPVDPSHTMVELQQKIQRVVNSTDVNRPEIHPIGLIAMFCERHHFEAKVLPQAMAAGWPRTIDFGTLEERVKALKEELHDIINDPSESVFFQGLMAVIREIGERRGLGLAGQQIFCEQYGQGTG